MDNIDGDRGGEYKRALIEIVNDQIRMWSSFNTFCNEIIFNAYFKIETLMYKLEKINIICRRLYQHG